jgi:hypothetical protein
MKMLMISALAIAIIGCTNSSKQGSSSDLEARRIQKASDVKITVEFDVLRAGVDYPVDSPRRESMTNKKVLVITSKSESQNRHRIIIDDFAKLNEPIAGLDYPTDMAIPKNLIGKKILVLREDYRIIADIQSATAGIDFPTETHKDYLVWVFSNTNRIKLASISSIEEDVGSNNFLAITVETGKMQVVQIP